MPIDLRTARERRGWDQKTLAEKSGVDQATISRLESGETTNPLSETVTKLERVLRRRLQFGVRGDEAVA